MKVFRIHQKDGEGWTIIGKFEVSTVPKSYAWELCWLLEHPEKEYMLMGARMYDIVEE